MRLSKICLAAVSAALVLSLASCAVDGAGTTTSSASQDSVSSTTAKSEKFVLNYPAHMQELGYTQAIELDKMPERIVCTSTYPVMTLYEMGVEMVGVPTTSVLDYPEDLTAEQIPSLGENFSAENLVDMNPDLVFMAPGQEDYGKTLESLGIPVYYMATNSQSHNIYDVIREQSESLVEAFSTDETLKTNTEKVMGQFDALDERVTELQEICEGKTVLMLLAGGPTSMYLQTEKATLGCMATMCGLESVYHNDQASSMIPLDMETALEYDPDLVLVTGMGTADDVKTLMEGIYDLNPEYWNSISAVADGRVMYLPGNYVSTAGINIINNIDDLATMLKEHYAAE